MANIWDRQDHDTDKSYRAFTEYLKLGYKRSFEKVASMLGYANKSDIGKWSAAHNWIERTSAYDTHRAKKSVDESINQTIDLTNNVIAFISILFKTLIDKSYNNKELEKLNVKDLSFIAASFTKFIPQLAELKRNSLDDLITTFGINNEQGLNLLDKLKNDDDAREQFDRFLELVSRNG